MSRASANRRSACLTAFTQEIERKLQRALNSLSQRLDLLQQIFADIALEIDDRAREVALVPEWSNKISLQADWDRFLLISGFLLFYNLAIFVIEHTDQLRKLKMEPVLLHYFSRMSALQGLELRMSTSTRLKSCLYSFTSPGGPMHPTRAVCHAAWDILDLLFPVGRYPWHVMSLFFRLLYSWCGPSSCWNFIITCQIYFILYMAVNSLWLGEEIQDFLRLTDVLYWNFVRKVS